MVRTSFALMILLFVGLSAPAYGDDFYVVDVLAYAKSRDATIPGTCSVFQWDADTVFYNLSNASVTVDLIGVSNEPINPTATRSFSIPAGTAASVRQHTRAGWQPLSGDGMWISHVRTSGPVAAESELLPSQLTLFCPGPGPSTLQTYGKTALPVFRALVPSGQRQTITGLTLGDVESHIYAFVYNGGTSAADVTIEVRRACDGSLVLTQHGSIPANTIRQFDAAPRPDNLGCPQVAGGVGLYRLAFATVTVSQPSLAFAAMLPDTQLPMSTVQVSGGSPPP